MVVAAGTVKAQSVSSSVFKFPDVVTQGQGKLFVSPLTNSGTENAEFASEFATKVSNKLMNGEQNKHNPWLTSKIYSKANGEGDADVVIGGIYKFVGKEKNSHEKVQSISKIDSIPFSYISYTNTANAEIIGDVVVKNNGSEIKTISIGDTKKKSNVTSFKKPEEKIDPATLYKKLEKGVIKKAVKPMLASLDNCTYKFERCKTKDKAIRKEYKEIVKGCRKMLNSDNIKEAGKQYIRLNDLEQSGAVTFNIGMCYEIIGNLTQAEKYYGLSGIKEVKKAQKRLDGLKKAQAFLKDRGVNVSEQEF